ncbi:MAG: excinuclease ABC subunit UvrB [candidate division WWE3 bacterium]|nr:excinuclease ABC subunit UvrB [candidate division WWE3 bacterium]
MEFKLTSSYKPAGDQPQAIKSLLSNYKAGLSDQVLLGVTGSGKTFTVANVIQEIKKPTLIISHNKTLAAQLYQEFKEFFPKNAVEYFVSYYDYYQPESYLPATDTYIEKDADINDEIDRLRLRATAALMTRSDVIIVASVSAIYSLGDPEEYSQAILELKVGSATTLRAHVLSRLIEMHYNRNDFESKRATFRVKGENIEVWPAYEDYILRLEYLGESLSRISKLNPITFGQIEPLSEFVLYPARHYVADPETFDEALAAIQVDLEKQLKSLEGQGKKLEAYRLKQRTKYDLEMLKEVGFVNGIENYSRYFDGRAPGSPPYTLLDFFAHRFGKASSKDWLLVVDESHISIPQIRGMYKGDRSRKQTLIDFGFRLPSALDNRPLDFPEFETRMPQTIYMSATPSPWELTRATVAASDLSSLSGQKATLTPIVEQLIRPTGLIDPQITVLPSKDQINDLRCRIEERIKNGQRVLVTTLTKRMAEELSDYLKNLNIKVTYLHSDIQTLERSTILDDLRRGNYDVLVGINLLREGLDLPEVSLVAILDADKEGFLRSESALIQVMGRAARHLQGEVVMYADKITDSMRRAIDEVDRRRSIQLSYNQEHNITPVGITKSIRDKMVEFTAAEIAEKSHPTVYSKKGGKASLIDLADVPPSERKKFIKELELKMQTAAEELNFELAAQIRDELLDIKKNL